MEMPKEETKQAKEFQGSSLASLLDERWRFPHKADVIDPELEKRPIEELGREKDRLKVESAKLDGELAKVRAELKRIASSSEMQWWEQTARDIRWWDGKRAAKVVRDPRFSALEKQRDVLREVRKIGMRQVRVSMQISLLNRLCRKI